MAELRLHTAPLTLDLKSVFDRARWRRVVILTYTFDLPFFESLLLPALLKGGATEVTVAADAAWLDERLGGWLDAGLVRDAGRRYALVGVRVPGTFHPKLILGVHADGGAVLAGSGNISTFGMATGGELFHVEEWTGETPIDTARQAWQICRAIAARLEVDALFRTRVDGLSDEAPGLIQQADGPLLHNLDEPIIDQLVRVLDGEEVRDLLFWSPFSDRRLEALETIVARLLPRSVRIALQPGISGFDGDRLRGLAADLSHVDWRYPAIKPGGGAFASPLPMIHAKGILARLASGEGVLMTGSPNLSRPALLATATGANLELAVVARGIGIEETLFDPTGPIQLGADVDLSDVSWRSGPETITKTDTRAITLIGARWDRGTLTLTVRGVVPTYAFARLSWPDPSIALQTAAIISTTPSADRATVDVSAFPPGASPLAVAIEWPGGRTGPVVVADIRRLAEVGGGEVRAGQTLPAIDYGDDIELTLILDELAQITVASMHDVDRLARGRSLPSYDDETAEVEGTAPAIDLSAIDFDRIARHPRMQGYAALGDDYAPSRIQLLLDEVVQQFDWLRERQRLRAVVPIATNDDEADPIDVEPDVERPRWSVRARTTVRWRNRLKRFVVGVRDRRFWELTTPDLMTQNYVLVLEMLRRLWERGADPETAILPRQNIATIGLAFMAGFWGNDEWPGYWRWLSEEDRLDVAVRLEERHGDALTLCMADRFMAIGGTEAVDAPFVIAGFVSAADEFGLLTVAAEEGAFIYLDDVGRVGGSLLASIKATANAFSWPRFCRLLRERHGLRAAKIDREQRKVNDRPVEVLEVTASMAIDRHAAPMVVFRAWAGALLSLDPDRVMFHMTWQADGSRYTDLWLWHRGEGEFTWQRTPLGGRPQMLMAKPAVALSDLKATILPARDFDSKELAS